MSLDLSAAVYTIDHTILLDRLENVVGVNRMALFWLMSYLTYHYEFVDVNDDICMYTKITVAIPQGSVLGPLVSLRPSNYKHGLRFQCYVQDVCSNKPR